jgi:glycosyltransferase involved in cell wall biosynthesis
MKVLHLVSSGGLFGAEKVILNLAACRGGPDGWVGAIHNLRNPHMEIIHEARRLGLKSAVFESRSQADFKTVSSLKKFLKENKIDILHTHNYKSDILGFTATRMLRIKWVATNHVWHGTDEKLRIYEAMDSLVLKFADMIFTVSGEIKDELLQKGIAEGKVHVVHNGIDVDDFSNASERRTLRGRWRVSGQDVLAAIIGRLAPEKGHEVLFQAVKEAVGKYPGLKCLVVGDGPLKSKLEGQAAELGLTGHIIFTGIRKDMPDVYAACDILVNSSFIEGLPMTILEAMASKLSVIATSVGAVPQVIRDGQNGILLKPGDPAALCRAITDLARNADKRQELAARAYKDVCLNFSVQRMAEEYNRFYQGLLQP